MPKTNIGQFDTTAANNTDVDGSTTAEGWAPSVVNNSFRALMALIAERNKDFGGYTATGTDTYAVSTTTTYTAYSEIEGLVVTFTNANTGAATLNVDSIGAAAIKKNGGQALVAGDIPAGGTFSLIHDGTDFEIIGKISGSSADDLITTRGDLIYGNASADAARLAVGTANQVLRSDGTDVSWGTVAVAGGGTGATTAASALSNLISGTSLTSATVASSDKVLIQDANDSDNLKTVTAESLAGLCITAETLANDGYIKLENGLIIQWGNSSSGTGGGTWTYPTSFPTAAFAAVGAVHDSDRVFGITSFGLSSLNFDRATTGGTSSSAACDFIVIGN